MVAGTIQSKTTVPDEAEGAGVATSPQHASQSALINRSNTVTGWGAPSLLQLACASANGAWATNSRLAKVRATFFMGQGSGACAVLAVKNGVGVSET